MLDIKMNDKQNKVVRSGNDDKVPVRMPNSNIIPFPTDMFVVMETQSLKDIFPTFLDSVGLVNTQVTDLSHTDIFKKRLKTMTEKFD